MYCYPEIVVVFVRSDAFALFGLSLLESTISSRKWMGDLESHLPTFVRKTTVPCGDMTFLLAMKRATANPLSSTKAYCKGRTKRHVLFRGTSIHLEELESDSSEQSWPVSTLSPVNKRKSLNGIAHGSWLALVSTQLTRSGWYDFGLQLIWEAFLSFGGCWRDGHLLDKCNDLGAWRGFKRC